MIILLFFALQLRIFPSLNRMLFGTFSLHGLRYEACGWHCNKEFLFCLKDELRRTKNLEHFFHLKLKECELHYSLGCIHCELSTYSSTTQSALGTKIFLNEYWGSLLGSLAKNLPSPGGMTQTKLICWRKNSTSCGHVTMDFLLWESSPDPLWESSPELPPREKTTLAGA